MRIDSLDIHDRITLTPMPISTDTQKAALPSTAFDDVLTAAVQHVNGLQKQANQSIQNVAGDGTSNIHETMIAMEKADLSFRLMLQVRNKVVDAYQEVMRMQV
jgi:flagellar hook-basal body complex protein FliE